jgi:DNA-directed RNA polymerase-3 subunit RPC5
VLPEYAYLVRGLWVCKSSLLFGDGYARKRDRVLLEFTKMESIHENALKAWINEEDPKGKRILFPLCKRRRILKDYKFISADLSFLKRHPHIANESVLDMLVR